MSDEKRRKARSDYVHRRMMQSTIAITLGVSEATIGRWKKAAKDAGDDWDKARGAQMIAGGGIEDVVRQTLAVVVQQVQATVESIQAAPDMDPATKVQMLASLADAYHKLMAVTKRLMPETDKLAVAMDVLKRFGDHIAKRKPSLAGEFVEQLASFGDEIARAYG